MSTATSLSGRVVLGRYRIVAPLARGGMGIIYLGRLEGAAGFAKPVVIKTVIPDAKDDRAAQLFAREARIVSNLQHPSIVGVLDFGEASGEYVMVLEYVHGFHLGAWSRFVQEVRGAMPIQHAVEVILPALDALDYAHRLTRADGTPLDIVHRDVSPANILLDQLGHVKLHDFGIARMADDEFKTQDGTFRGTLSYTAPETLQGVAASPRSDLYACAVVLYQVIGGSNPFRGQQASETLHRVVTHVPPGLRSLRPEVSEALEAAISRALEKDPERRFESAGAFAAALRAARSWDEAEALSDLQRVIHEDFMGALPTVMGLESLQSRDAAWRAAQSTPQRIPLSSSRPPAGPNEGGTETGAGGLDPQATVRALPSSALLDLVRSQEGAGAATAARADDAAAPAVASQGKRRSGVVLAAALAILGLGGAAFAFLRPAAPPPPPRFLLIEKQADVPTPPPAQSVASPRGAVPVSVSALAMATKAPKSTPAPVKSAGASGATGSSITAAFQRQRGRVEACFRQNADAASQPQLTLRFRLEPSGAVQSAELVPASLAGTPLGGCILAVARSTKFPAGEAPVSFTIPITARRAGP